MSGTRRNERALDWLAQRRLAPVQDHRDGQEAQPQSRPTMLVAVARGTTNSNR
jgi:hypothetical protein